MRLSNLKTEINMALDNQKVQIIDYLTNENILLKAEIFELKEQINQKGDKVVDIERDVDFVSLKNTKQTNCFSP